MEKNKIQSPRWLRRYSFRSIIYRFNCRYASLPGIEFEGPNGIHSEHD